MDDVIVILTSLLIFLPLVFKAIEKKLMQSGNQSSADKVRKFREMLENEDKDSEKDTVLDEAFPSHPVVPEVEVAPVYDTVETPPSVQKPAVPDELLEDGYRSIKDIIEERQKKSAPKPGPSVQDTRERFRVDPKKLILYSEIMKAKF